ncbi:acyl-CoA thioesterase [Glutamicibacter sp.]|jgi:Predicted thioesterase|uniref:acyl-CoA thioesterase n=1 Tax=Glutamicibacter sp. TaxID=1931995 RepID=UPI002B470969|nr:thioesterase family protein [Glutamicibacter sp.]HJX78440.1 thioesterase family protein [Glutamicibacter sp.]
MSNREKASAAEASLSTLVKVFLASGVNGEALQRTIEWVDTDAAGHQHNSAIMHFVEAAEAKLFRDAGADSYFAMAPRVRQEIDFSAKLFFGQEVTAAVRVERIGTSSMTFGFKVWGHPHQERGLVLAAEGKFVTVCAPPSGEGAAPWPREILAALGTGT